MHARTSTHTRCHTYYKALPKWSVNTHSIHCNCVRLFSRVIKSWWHVYGTEVPVVVQFTEFCSPIQNNFGTSQLLVCLTFKCNLFLRKLCPDFQLVFQRFSQTTDSPILCCRHRLLFCVRYVTLQPVLLLYYPSETKTKFGRKHYHEISQTWAFF